MSDGIKPILVLVGSLGLLAIAFFGFLLFMEWPGGMPPSYDAEDYDARLTREAATAKPLILALQRYHDDHSTFPVDAAELVPYLPSPPDPPAKALGTTGMYEILGWYYMRREGGAGYLLSRRLGWDPSLKYYSDGSESRWAFEPGDGTPEKTILLKP